MEEVDKESPEYKAFLKYVAKKEAAGKDWVLTLDAQLNLLNWKEKYNVEKASKLHCPFCEGTLYANKSEPGVQTCRGCSLTWFIETRSPERFAELLARREEERAARKAEKQERDAEWERNTPLAGPHGPDSGGQF